MRIAICPGHHTNAKGAENKKHKLTENDVAIEIIKIAEELLRADGHTVQVFAGKLSEKVKRINATVPKFDLAFDLHFNADAELEDTDDKKGYGVMVMHYPTSAARKSQADKMSAAIAKKLGERDLGGRKGLYWGGSDPGTKPDYFTDKTNCPAFIPEPGYIDNNGFAKKFLTTKEGLTKVAESLVEAVRAFEA